jgi:co-chaperonin GroES (HSP10)
MRAKASKIKPVQKHILVRDMNFDEQYTASGIYIPSDNGKSEGVKPRWGKVFAVGPEQTDFKIGEWVLIEHGRWTRGLTVEDDDGTEFTIWRVEEKSIMLRADQKPEGLEYGKYVSPTHGSEIRPEDFIK